jgi:hypothetical protein
MALSTKFGVGLLALSIVSGMALAQPAATDLGDLTSGGTLNGSGNVDATTTIGWYKFNLRFDATIASGFNLKIETSPAGLGDTEIGLFRADGTLVASDDDDSPNGLYSLLSFGASGCQSGGAATLDGNLPAGEYYLAVVDYNAVFADSFSVTPGTDAGGYAFTIVAGTGDVPPANPYTEVNSGAAHDLPSNAEEITGSSQVGAIIGALLVGEADMYKVRISDPAAFLATLRCGAGFDSQLFIFNESGVGVAFNDDIAATTTINRQSEIGPTLIPSAGIYYIAVSQFDRDPLDSAGAELWLDQPFEGQRGPDAAGAANPVSSWSAGGAANNYTLFLTGVTGTGGGGPTCPADLDDDGVFPGQVRDGGVTIDDLVYFVTAFGQGDLSVDLDNGTGTGTQDQGVTIDDLVYFLQHFADGC